MKNRWSLLFGITILAASLAIGCKAGNPFNMWGSPPTNPYAQPTYQQGAPVSPSYGGAATYGPGNYGNGGGGFSGQPIGSGSAPAAGGYGSGTQ